MAMMVSFGGWSSASTLCSGIRLNSDTEKYLNGEELIEAVRRANTDEVLVVPDRGKFKIDYKKGKVMTTDASSKKWRLLPFLKRVPHPDLPRETLPFGYCSIDDDVDLTAPFLFAQSD